MPATLPDATTRHPITLPDGSPHLPTVFLNQVIDHPNITIGDYTYYSDFGQVDDYAAHIAPYLYPGAPEQLKIGRFCQIAHGVRFITASANHPMRGFSAFPFAVFTPETMGTYRDEVSQHGDTIVGHDVWIGYEAVIMPGVTIGNGAIIAARSVVTANVPAYAIVAGNPARAVRMRFEPETIERLEGLRWWDWPKEKIEHHADALTAGVLDLLKGI
jgi:virginiamycin A acetyltransferase